jgi:hypothetical protein
MEISIKVFWRPTLDAADQEIRFAKEITRPSDVPRPYDVPVPGDRIPLGEDERLRFPVKAVEWDEDRATVELILTEEDITIDELKRVGF